MSRRATIKAEVIRIGFWGPLCYTFNIRNTQNSIGKYLGPYSMSSALAFRAKRFGEGTAERVEGLRIY